MSTFVFIHGGWSASWAWERNVKALENGGHRVICLDLVGHGTNEPERLEKVGLRDHVGYIEEEIAKMDGNVILVGHSMAGMIISQVAEDLGDKIEKLVYFAAFLPSKDGQNMIPFIEKDLWTLVGPHTALGLPNGLLKFNPRYLRNTGFNTTDDETFAFADAHLGLENPTMWGDPVHLTEVYHNVPKYYVHTLKDNCCTYYLQRCMVHDEPVIKEYYIDSDHFGMLNRADEVNEVLLDIAANVVPK